MNKLFVPLTTVAAILAGCSTPEERTAAHQAAQAAARARETEALADAMVSAINQPNRALTIFVLFVLVIFLVGVGIYIWRKDQEDKLRMAGAYPYQQPYQPVHPQIAGPQAAQAGRQLPDNISAALDLYADRNDCVWVMRNGQAVFLDPHTLEVVQTSKKLLSVDTNR